MKLLLVDGSIVTTSGYRHGSVVLNGTTVASVEITVTGHTLDEVKAIFADQENLGNMKLYTDDNVLTEELVGYQIRTSTSFGNTEDEFTITLAKSSETLERMKAVETTVANMKDVISSLKSQWESYSESNQQLASSCNDAVERLAEVTTITEQQNANYAAIAEANEKHTVALQEVKNEYANISSKYSEFAETSVAMNQKYTEINSQMTEMVRVAGDYRQSIEDFSNRMMLNDEAFEATRRTLDNAADAISENGRELTLLRQVTENTTREVTNISDSASETAATVANVQRTIEGIEGRVQVLEPVTDYTTLSLEDAKAYRIKESEDALAEYLETHPITSTCHQGISATYSITKEKQTYLQAMIMTTQLAQASGTDYQPSWNASGEVCTYDWTLDELSQLGFEIEAVVRPLVNKQQRIEKDIMGCTSMDDLKAVVISYNN